MVLVDRNQLRNGGAESRRQRATPPCRGAAPSRIVGARTAASGAPMPSALPAGRCRRAGDHRCTARAWTKTTLQAGGNGAFLRRAKGVGKGTGLGLSMVYGLAEQSGGQRPGGGPFLSACRRSVALLKRKCRSRMDHRRRARAQRSEPPSPQAQPSRGALWPQTRQAAAPAIIRGPDRSRFEAAAEGVRALLAVVIAGYGVQGLRLGTCTMKYLALGLVLAAPATLGSGCFFPSPARGRRRHRLRLQRRWCSARITLTAPMWIRPVQPGPPLALTAKGGLTAARSLSTNLR